MDTIRWNEGCVQLIDQTLLPAELVYKNCCSVEEVAEAIESLRIRGAPAIGVAAAFGVALGAHRIRVEERENFLKELERAMERLEATRPTAVNLFWALDRMRAALERCRTESVEAMRQCLLAEALRIQEEDSAVCRAMGFHGAELLEDGMTVLTHCNTGGLATAGYGTALGVIYAAREQGKRIRVIADETRPLLQGARLTAWELMRNGFDVTLICDNTAAWVMKKGEADCVIVGADRIARNGDVANKIGTYSLAIAAKAHGIPFYVAAPFSTIDRSLAGGEGIPIEERNPEEITSLAGTRFAPESVKVYNPAFDVTPHRYLTAIVSEMGVARAPYEEAFDRWAGTGTAAVGPPTQRRTPVKRPAD